MTNRPVGIRSLAVSFPSTIRTNDYWQNKFPDLFGETKPKRARLSRKTTSISGNNGLDIWSQEVAPYLSDPFRGNVERRVLAPDETSLTLEYQAAKDALKAAKISPEEVDLMIVASLLSEQMGAGNAAYLARQLKLNAPAWNLESTCSSALVALQNAHALIQIGEYRNVLVVVSQIGSKSVDEQDTLSLSMGDGAGAFVVDRLKPNQGILGSKIIHTNATCEAYLHELVTDDQGKPRMLTRTGENANMLAETAVDSVRTCCQGALKAAGVSLEEIDFFAFNTPTAWYASVCTRALEIDPKRTLNIYPRYANIGPVLPVANLYHAAQAGKISENDLVLVYTNGAAATAVAMVMRWGEVTLGKAPAPPISITEQDERIEQFGKGSISKEQSQATKSSSISREELLAAEPEKRQQMLEVYLLEWLVSSLQITLAEISLHHPLALLLDSLMAFELRRRIENDLGVLVPVEKFFGENNIAKLTKLILNQLALANLVASEPLAVAEVKEEEEREKISL
ncbi:MAG: 3-oxoacyl-ACP synthase [Symploca sp. SIO2E9]|nr:3-oxoacyl-ACP synthase [Symploca sp. SIO2E9]